MSSDSSPLFSENTITLTFEIFGGDASDLVSAEHRSSPISHLKRTSSFLTHPIFNSHHSETSLMRYLYNLEKRDLCLNTSAVPLGSCTMKLNAATALMPGILLNFFEFLLHITQFPLLSASLLFLAPLQVCREANFKVTVHYKKLFGENIFVQDNLPLMKEKHIRAKTKFEKKKFLN